MRADTPTTAKVHIRYAYAAYVDGERPYEAVYDAFTRWLATVRPNPDDQRQVETVARALCTHDGFDADELIAGRAQWRWYSSAARAVLAALAALGAAE